MMQKDKAPRKMWNYRCDDCRCETPVYSDTNLCYYCDPASSEELWRKDVEENS